MSTLAEIEDAVESLPEREKKAPPARLSVETRHAADRRHGA
jgi:hypothetical protein